MMSALKAFLLALFASKRALTVLAGLLLTVVNPILVKVGIDVTPDEVAVALQFLGAMVMGAGVADAMKDAKAAPTVAKPSDTELLNPFEEKK